MNTLNTSLHHIIDEGSDQQTLQALCKSMGRDGLIMAGLPADLADSIAKSVMKNDLVPKLVPVHRNGKVTQEVRYTKANKDISGGDTDTAYEVKFVPDDTKVYRRGFPVKKDGKYLRNGKPSITERGREKFQETMNHKYDSQKKEAKQAYAAGERLTSNGKTMVRRNAVWCDTGKPTEQQQQYVRDHKKEYIDAIVGKTFPYRFAGTGEVADIKVKFIGIFKKGWKKELTHPAERMASRGITPAKLSRIMDDPVHITDGNMPNTAVVWGDENRIVFVIDPENNTADVKSIVPIDHEDDKKLVEHFRKQKDIAVRQAEKLNATVGKEKEKQRIREIRLRNVHKKKKK